MEKLDYRELVQKIINQHAYEHSEEDLETTEIVRLRTRSLFIVICGMA
ncbi:hypothetical protein [Okeania sp. SIO2C9]